MGKVMKRDKGWIFHDLFPKELKDIESDMSWLAAYRN